VHRIGYTSDGRPWGRVYKNGWLPDGPGWYLRGNGGIQSTLADLYRWHLALEAGKVLSADAVKKFQTGYVTSMGGERYGCGWGGQTTRRGTKVVTHNGGNGFMFSDVRRYLDEKVVIIAMSNQPTVPATQLAPRQLESLVFGDAEVVMPPVPVEVAKERREARAGRYALTGPAAGARVAVTVRATAAGLEAESDDPALLGGLGVMAAPAGRIQRPAAGAGRAGRRVAGELGLLQLSRSRARAVHVRRRRHAAARDSEGDVHGDETVEGSGLPPSLASCVSELRRGRHGSRRRARGPPLDFARGALSEVPNRPTRRAGLTADGGRR
jgi:hypothetical protein